MHKNKFFYPVILLFLFIWLASLYNNNMPKCKIYACTYANILYTFNDNKWSELIHPIAPKLPSKCEYRAPLNGFDKFIVTYRGEGIFELFKDDKDVWTRKVFLETDSPVYAPKYIDKETLGFIDRDGYVNTYNLITHEMKRHVKTYMNSHGWINDREFLTEKTNNILIKYNTDSKDEVIISDNAQFFSLSQNKRYLFYRHANALNKGTLIDLETDNRQIISLPSGYCWDTTKPSDTGEYVVALIYRYENNSIYHDDIYFVQSKNSGMIRTGYPLNRAEEILLEEFN